MARVKAYVEAASTHVWNHVRLLPKRLNRAFPKKGQTIELALGD
jgi:hypothetical protein